MQFGVNLLGLAQQPRDQDMQERFSQLLDWVHAVRDAGYDHLTMGQHYLTAPFQQFQPVPLLSRLIPETGTMRMYSTLVVPLLNPVELAETWASLDILSNGRVGMCLALGYRDEEYAAFGVDRKTRVRRLHDIVTTLRRLWTEDDVTAEGLNFALDQQTVTLRPVQKPHPPIWIAANADAAVVRAARWGLPWNINPHATHETVARQVGLYKDAWREAGHKGEATFPISREVFCAETREDAVRLAFPHLGRKYAAYGSWGQDKQLPGEESFAVPLEELAGDRFIIGDPDDCAREIARYQELGIDRVHLRTNWPGMPLDTALTGMRLFAREVAPRFRRGEGA
jgi:alkanesulfonate monooxygenase SsuD/methylene tetrahydromethanopterin reductase-like flavin-dependent oxidoreductase (luciferase family)